MAIPWRVLPGRIPTWLRDHDPGLVATRRAARTALVMPALFALCSQVLHPSTMATFAAFGSFPMLLLVEFTGPYRPAAGNVCPLRSGVRCVLWLEVALVPGA
ncbi:hypothetical protein AB0D14_44995 [Streptomyces sp. NPDC048484]|uniref:hypothetical protein n=1 Tax=Streptomyces sp. NPDC048484 TaxID=3155146 RepID=UPI00344AF1E5